MRYSIEDVKRLVPEATHFNHAGYGLEFKLPGVWLEASTGLGKTLLDTRRQLEIARDALSGIEIFFDADGEGPDTWENLAVKMQEVARETLAAIEGVTK
jgi:hypothetical protein